MLGMTNPFFTGIESGQGGPPAGARSDEQARQVSKTPLSACALGDWAGLRGVRLRGFFTTESTEFTETGNLGRRNYETRERREIGNGGIVCPLDKAYLCALCVLCGENMIVCPTFPAFLHS